ncbi:MAG: DNA recombination protein RmuC [Deltaproteobacteria bacterium]|nr:DNA recombination protein RmuC [Deltaproteobacteria bacterium]
MNGMAVALLLALLCGAVLIGYWLARRRAGRAQAEATPLVLLHQQVEAMREQLRANLEGQSTQLGQQLQLVQQQVATLLDKQAQTLHNTSSTLHERLDNAAKVIGEMHRELGKVASTVQAVGEIKDILKAPKLRGGFGELLLADLLAQVLPAEHFSMQHRFRDGKVVDAVIQLGTKLVPLDSKFPLENFQKAVGATSDEERKPARRQFLTDVRRHIEAVAGYIRPDEGTYDFALMYIPAENIYYEVAVKNEWGPDDRPMLEQALKQRVIPVSPNTLYAYLVTIAMGLKGMQVERYAQEIIDRLGRLQKEFDRFQADFAVIGTHLSNARAKYDDAEKRLTRVGDRLTTFGPHEEPAALPTPTEIKEETIN